MPFSSKRIVKIHQLTAAVALALSAGWSYEASAAGLGRLTVQSALGQPLRAEVEVTAVGKDEANSLAARLASPDAFKLAGLEYNSALTGLRFALEKRPDGRSIIKITSSQPVNEPFVDLLLELNWASGKFVREYTFLLDPPELKINREPVPGTTPSVAVLPPIIAPSSAPPVVAPTVSLPPVITSNPLPEPALSKVAKPVAAKQASKPAVEGDYAVKRGDTLAVIASKSKGSEVNLEQAIVAIYRANPSAFFGNVNQLKAGSSLTIPDQAAMAAVSVAEARQVVRVRSANFQEAKTRLAAKPSKVMTAKAGQSASGSVSAKVDEANSASAKGDQLRLSRSKAAPGSDATATGSKSATALAAADKAEAKVARDAATKESRGRVSDLEKNVADLQKLLELKNKQLSELEKQVADAKNAPPKLATGTIAKAEPAKIEAPKVETPKIEVPKVEAPKIEAPKIENPKIEAPKVEASKIEIPKVEAPKVEAPKVDVPKPELIPPITSAGTNAEKLPSTPASAANLPPATLPSPTPAASAPLPPETSMLDDLLENPLALGGLGGLALLGGGYALYAMRKRKKVEKFEDSLIAGEGLTANSLFGSTGGQVVDTTTGNSVFATGMNTNSEAASTEVDPVAEAEVYIAYGREAQAEEILRDSLKKQPERQNARLKLLEILAARKDTSAFGLVAKEMFDQTGGQNEEWPKVITLGLSIDPNNALYSGNTDSGFGSGVLPNDDNPPTFMAELHTDDPQAAAVAKPVAFAATEPMKSSADEFAGLDFDLGNDSSTISRAGNHLNAGLASPARTETTSLENAIGGSFDLPSLDLSSLKTTEPQFQSGSNPLADLGDFKIDLASLEQVTISRELPAVDLSSISLDLQSSQPKPSSRSFDGGNEAIATAHASVELASADNSKWQEMATKLDLASAYEEIGDKEGARELLNEVVAEGDPGQQQKARMMLSKI